jgi:mannitol/fructose-specific phosphotransferase system IIA component (Ntr-type)
MSVSKPEPVPSTMTLADFTSQRLVIEALRADCGVAAIAELGALLQREACLPDSLPFYQAVINGEFLASTAIEPGLAFPHALVSGLLQVRFALGRSGRPLPWFGSTTGAVRLVFLLAVPATNATDYLKLLAALACLGKDGEVLAALLGAKAASGMIEALERIQVRQAAPVAG